MTKEHLNVYIQKEDSIGWAILIMVYLHVFGARAIDLPAYQSIHDVYIHGELLSYILSKFCSICGYGFYILYRRKVDQNASMRRFQRFVTLICKVAIIGCIFYPISLLYPDLGWNLNHIYQLFLGYEGNYEWWFLRPYIIILLFSFQIISVFDKYPVRTSIISICLYFFVKLLIYNNIRVVPLIVEQLFILLPAFFIGISLAKWGFLVVARRYSLRIRNIFIAWVVLLVLIIYKSILPFGVIDFLIAGVFVFCAIIIRPCFGKNAGLLIKLGREATSIWLIHTFIAIYYWADIIYSFRYPIIIYIAVLICSYICSKAIAVLYNPIRAKLVSLFA